MSQCNYCTLQTIKRQAKQEGLCVTVDAAGNVYAHPCSVEVATHPSSSGPRSEYWRAWFMELSSRCTC
jgi:hypothetical protein